MPPHFIPGVKAEIKQINNLFGQFNISPKQARRRVRGIFGDGGYQRTDEREVPDLSTESSVVSDRAAEIAREAGAPFVAPPHLLAALLEIQYEHIRQLLEELKVDWDSLREAAGKIAPMPQEGEASTIYLDTYSTDLTKAARDGKLSPAMGRREEMFQVIRTLGRETKNNPIPVGEAGVGKKVVS